MSGVEKGDTRKVGEGRERRKMKTKREEEKERKQNRKRGFGGRELLNLLEVFVVLFLLCLSI